MPSPVNYTQLQSELKNHPNRKFVENLINGFIHGFDTKVQSVEISTKECNNLLSAQNNEHAINLLVQSEVDKGYLSGPYAQPPFSSYRVSPIGLVQGKYSFKQRLIVDLSAPHSHSHHPSINDMIAKEECSLSYVRIDDAIKQLLVCGKGAQMCKADISDAFKLIPIRPAQYHLYCIRWQGLYYFYTRLSFGCRSSPVIFDEFSKAVCWIAEHNYGINFILHLLDDFLTIDKPGMDANKTMFALLQLFSHLNVPLSAHKTTGPTPVIEYLGIILDSLNMQARLPLDKVERIAAMLELLLHRKKCTKRELLQLLGHLNFASRVIPPGRSFVSYLLKLATTVKELHHRVYLTLSCREDLHMWLIFLKQWNGTSFFYDPHITAAPDMELYTDASSTIGYGGYYLGRWFCDTWPADLLPCDEDETVSMAFMELYPIVVAATMWGSLWSTKRILFYCDNAATVHILRKGRSKVNSIMRLMRQLTWLSATNNFCIYAEHIPGVHNILADCLSRLQVERFRQLAPGADAMPHTCPPPAEVFWNPQRVLQA